MARTMICDNCNERIAIARPYDTPMYVINVRSEGMRMTYGNMIDKDFCSIECLATWATKRAAQ